MIKLEFTLKQHTPLIHFQHDQSGATLRATEVKPKLDKFIIKELGGFEKLKKDNPNWLIGDGKHPALDYRIKIQPNNQSIKFLKEEGHTGGISNPLYFGNMGDSPAKHYSITEKVKVTFFSFNHALLIHLDEEKVCKFFFINNFSTRQTKGIGCFYPIEFNGRTVTTHPEKFILPNTPKIEINSLKDEDIFATIDYFWKWLKSGINYNGNPYKDSILKLFISESTNYKWEKREVKELFLGLSPNAEIKYFVRAFLGLPDNFSYKWVSASKRKTGEIYSQVDLILNITCKDKEIQRNPSPFIFIPFKENSKTTIYVLSNSTYLNRLVNKEFELIAQVSPIKLTVGWDNQNGRAIRKTIYPDMSKFNADKILVEAERYFEEIDDFKMRNKQKQMIEKAKDFIDFFNSGASAIIAGNKTIKTPCNIPDLENFLAYSIAIIGNKFDVKDFNGNTIITAKIF